MNKTASEAVDLIEEIKSSVGDQTSVQVCVCPPFTSLSQSSESVEKSEVLLGAQDMNAAQSGAFTGEISAEMLRDLYVSFVILGHSERRQLFGETNQIVNQKIHAAIGNNLKPIYCIGETLDEREAGKTLDIVRTQVREGLENFPSHSIENLVIAYEPIWSIGTGKIPTAQDLQKTTIYIKKVLKGLFKKNSPAVLYGGSVDGSTVEMFKQIKEIDGFLIGGASKSSKKFIDIIKNYYR